MMKEKIVICMPVKNAEDTLHRAITSVLNQENTRRDVILLIGNDNSNDDSLNIVNEFLPNTKIELLNINFGKVYRVRNYLNEYARQVISGCVLLGRLDADDVLIDNNVISKVESLFDEHDFDVLICGNQQSRNFNILEWRNQPSIQLLDNAFLLSKLKKMANGEQESELPSCNTFIKPTVKVDYPEKASAEDHWLTVLLLLQKDRLNIHISEELLYCVYSLDGFQTSSNQKIDVYMKSRVELYHFFQNRMEQCYE